MAGSGQRSGDGGGPPPGFLLQSVKEGPGQVAVHARGAGVHACIAGEAEGQVRQQRQFVGIMESYMLAVSQTEPS
ncbi:hypothetical protein THAOC_28579 [Thalassiosira oceanica]|uniref:Uncharacterized protein n=1 Tax=Thalassiosira oceanica TaxID=159749 RepID=K0RG24_THAOC|nr:hypothetical protein THAOC_28579 [Thalassiosira oceanica]|eukprot:EJK52175.1 hypothetical protein THAOC_28579 [Thalassiosira oceanica]